MKINLVVVLLLLVSVQVLSQDKYEFERVDSIPNKSKSEIYAGTKMYITNYLVLSKDDIMNDDKESGTILIKSRTIQEVNDKWGNRHTYRYTYDITFRMRDQKCKVTIKNVRCASAYISSMEIQKIQPFWDNYYERPKGKFTLPFPKAYEMMSGLTEYMELITNGYSKYVAAAETNDDW